MSTPDRIGRFVVTGQAGGGGFATVFRAQDEALQSAVAIKVLGANWMSSDDVRGRFLAEARLLRRADSDRVVRVHDVGELPDGRPYLVMTFADRGTLHERLATGPLPWRAAVAVAVEIALGLQVLHDAGILHRDIKPSNVLFRSQPGGREQVLLGDLGLGKLLAEGSVLTLVAGTPGYMAPEQGISGAPVSVRTDVYAVGAVLFRAVTGRGPGEPEVVVYPGQQSTVPPSRLAPGIPQELDHVVLRAMSRDPHYRHPDVRALLADLHRLTAAPTPPPLPTGVLHPYRQFPPQNTSVRMRDDTRRRRWVVPATAGALVLAAAGTVAAFEPWQQSTEVRSDTPGVRLVVPRGWAGEVAGSGWNPGLLGVAGDPQPGVLVAPSAADFSDTGDTRPGAFAGALPTADEPTADAFVARVTRADCAPADGAVPTGDEVLAGVRQRCGAVVLDDVLLRRSDRLAWVQVKQPADATTATAEVVDSVRLG